jgi:hypothetical protein
MHCAADLPLKAQGSERLANRKPHDGIDAAGGAAAWRSWIKVYLFSRHQRCGVPCNDFAGSPLFYIDIDQPSNFPQKTKVTLSLNRMVTSFPHLTRNRPFTRHGATSLG